MAQDEYNNNPEQQNGTQGGRSQDDDIGHNEAAATTNLPAVIVGGSYEDDDPDVIDRNRRKRMQQFEQTHQAQTGFGAAAAPEEKEAEAPQADTEEAATGKRTLAGRIGHRALGVVTKGDEIGANPDSHGKISDRQLKAMIKVGVLEKGWDTLHLYDRKSGDIDPNLTSRANKILDTMQRRGEVPENISFSSKAQDVKPWQHFKGTRQKIANYKHKLENRTDQSVDSISRPFREAAHGVAWKESARPAAAASAESQKPEDLATNNRNVGAPPAAGL